MNEKSRTQESRLLDEYPGLREFVESLPEFLQWHQNQPHVEVDDEAFTVVGGDQLKDRDQTIVEWVRRFRPELLNRSD